MTRSLVKLEADIQSPTDNYKIFLAISSKLNMTRGKHSNIGRWVCQSISIQAPPQFFPEYSDPDLKNLCKARNTALENCRKRKEERIGDLKKNNNKKLLKKYPCPKI